MPGQQYPAPITTAPSSPINLGQRRFAGDATNDNRGDGWMSHDHDSSSIQNYQQPDPYAWMSGYGGYGYDPYGYMYGGYYDPYGYGAYDMATNTSVSNDAHVEKWGEVEQTTLDQLNEQGAVRAYDEGAVLVIANGPEDMRKLDHAAEADMINNAMGGERQTVVLWNPSADALQAMLKEGHFQDVVLSGHGGDGTVYMTGADGEAVAVDGNTFASYFDDSGVQNVFLNMCHGSGGENSVAQSLAVAGMNVLGWTTAVEDDTAKGAAETLGALFADGSSTDDLAAAASTNTNLTFTAAQGPAQATNTTTGAEATAEATEDAAAQQPAAPEAAPAAAAEVAPEIDPAILAEIEFAKWNMGAGGFMYY